MEEKGRKVINLINPLKQIRGQLPKLYMVTQDEIEDVLGKTLTIGVIDTNHLRFIRGWEEVEVIMVEDIEQDREKGEEGIRGIEQVIKTRKGKIKIVYTYIKIRVIYARSKRTEGIKYYYRGYKIERVRNIGIRMFDGLIPLDKNNGRETLEIIKSNKRVLIRKGVKYIDNELSSRIGYVETIVENENDLNRLKEERVDISSFIEELIEEDIRYI